MNISIDGGGLCAHKTTKFGNYTFTKNIIQALLRYDKKNSYTIYSFCPIPKGIFLSRHWRYKILLPTRLWMKLRVSLEEMIHPKHIFLGLNQAVPMFTYAKIISFSHGLSYYYFPHHYRESFARLSTQLVPMVKNSAYIVVSSEKVKTEMEEAYPWYKNTVVIPFGIPFDMPPPENSLQEIKKYFLYVGMDHPVKNLRFITTVFSRFRSIQKYRGYKLILVGPAGMRGSKSKNIQIISEIKRPELRKLYQEAASYLTASLYESFNYPVLEALSQNCPVIGLSSAVIPELEPFASTVKTKDEFLAKMIVCAEGKHKHIDLEKLQTIFSWERYVDKLIKLCH